MRQLGAPPIPLHDPRHAWATMALAAGVYPRAVRESLGHASIGITMDTYSHVTAALHADAAEQVAALVWPGRSQTVTRRADPVGPYGL